MPGRTERELAQDSIDTVGQILSNYQAALHLLEVSGDAGAAPRASAPEVLRQTAAEVFTPVLDACGGVAPGLEALVEESIGAAGPGQGVPAHAIATS